MTKYLFVRHGESEANLLHEFSNRGWKHGLTDLGIKQANSLAMRLQDYSIGAIYTSPLLRAWQTAEIVGRAVNIVPQIANELIEFDTGALEGKSDQDSWNLYYEITNDWFIRKKYSRRFDRGDSFESILARFLPFFALIRQRHSHSDQAVLFVGHGGTFLCTLPIVFEQIDVNFALQHRLGHTDIVVAEEFEGKLSCLVWGGEIIIQP